MAQRLLHLFRTQALPKGIVGSSPTASAKLKRIRASGEIGKHKALKMLREKSLTSSSLVSPTNLENLICGRGEMADTTVLEAVGGNLMRVQVSPSAPILWRV